MTTWLGALYPIVGRNLDALVYRISSFFHFCYSIAVRNLKTWLRRHNVKPFVRGNNLQAFAFRVFIPGHGDFSYTNSWRVIALSRFG